MKLDTLVSIWLKNYLSQLVEGNSLSFIKVGMNVHWYIVYNVPQYRVTAVQTDKSSVKLLLKSKTVVTEKRVALASVMSCLRVPIMQCYCTMTLSYSNLYRQHCSGRR